METAIALHALTALVVLGIWPRRGPKAPGATGTTEPLGSVVAAKPVSATTENTYEILELSSESELNQVVWHEERKARERGLAPVLELHLPSNPLSKQLTDFWGLECQELSDTLEGICLLRVDVSKIGPAGALQLTPHAAMGLPLLLGWNSIGQLLGPGELAAMTTESLCEDLSLFFHAVASGQPYRASNSRAPVKRQQPASAAAASPEAAELSTASQEGNSTEEPPKAIPPERAAREDEISQLAAALPSVLQRSLTAAKEYLRSCGLPADGSIDSLQQLDTHLDRTDIGPAFVQRHLTPLAVYWGTTVQAASDAQWQVSLDARSLTEALCLTIGGQEGLQPVCVVLECIQDPQRSLFGAAVAARAQLDLSK